MLRYAVLGLISLVASNAWAQQTPQPPDGTPASSSSPSSVKPSKAVVVMEEPLPGDNWTYEIRDEITGKILATRTDVVTEVTPKEISVTFKIAGKSNDGFNVYDRSWNLMSAGEWKYSPNDSLGIKMPTFSTVPCKVKLAIASMEISAFWPGFTLLTIDS